MNLSHFFRPDPSDKNACGVYRHYGPFFFFRARLYWASVPFLSRFLPYSLWGLVGVALCVTSPFSYLHDSFVLPFLCWLDKHSPPTE